MTDDTDDWAQQLRDNREEKDRFFAEHRQSPIPPGERDSFDGLDYFPPDPEYRVTASVTVHDEPEPIEMDTTEGRTVRYLRIVTFEFELDGESHELHGYRQENDDGSIFVPIRDKTTGQETYEHGRYMELEPDRELTDGDEVTLDFNLAYSPFCAFSDTFDCPLPPEENWLETTVEAGERTP
ncbi:hypothetical protein SAMN05216388_1005139 [Halorientalis persicus]|jgi:uncharacterized protein (DUF1684 family)|uniref:DUF1684 domain-containing protein n=1 Tax=Halorientalis persicus TaxID=1367881 RepID=A0A1H8JQF2_9EURY|nr:DUF1684 domain-containing protein [Halorientalis persicus]SEN82556.1 hypothetical protein SAMN05216388_1005139 [Halorientalis persicus]